ncbi:MAG: 2-C-methyl-D-erythritol 4-phosphate cytidylyltransferase [Desulfovibrionaceae bacterium]|nr:2-C-methyl-D-erythritol 4-phosphate cytidylyltransferase [Desulfovibrionaceae bacterium]
MALSFQPWVVLVAAGSGSRMAQATGGTAKQFISWQGAPLYWHAAKALASCPALAGIVFVFPAPCLDEEKARLAALDAGAVLGVRWLAVAGGARRQDSVYQGLCALPPECRHVLVHDAARPFVSPALVQRVCAALQAGARGVIPAVALSDTIKQVQDNIVLRTLPRESLAAVQTPQGFALPALKQAHEAAQQEQWAVTDDASLLEACALPVTVVAGDVNNSKITYGEDIAMLCPQAQNALPCTGFGYDVHRFGTGRPMKLGGVLIPNAPEVLAHSDGDVLLHALMDALLGAACLGDIGQHFPDTAAQFDNISSAVLLNTVLGMVQEAGIELVQADLTIITQVPKISPHRDAIKRNIARLLGLDPAFVNVKASTEEGLGFTGAREGIKAVAQVTALRRPLSGVA